MLHMPKSSSNILLTPKTPHFLFFLLTTCLSSLDLLQKRFPIRTPKGQQKPLPFPQPNMVNNSLTLYSYIWLNPYMSQTNITQSIPSGSYQQEYHTIIINTSISGPTPLSNKEFIVGSLQPCPPFVENSFVQTLLPLSTPLSIPSLIDLGHQHKLFKWLHDLCISQRVPDVTN